jgi:hypothetical protein
VERTKCESCVAADDTMNGQQMFVSAEFDSNDDSKTVKGNRNVFGSAADDDDEKNVLPERMTRETTVVDSEVYGEGNMGAEEDTEDETDIEAEGGELDIGEGKEMGGLYSEDGGLNGEEEGDEGGEWSDKTSNSGTVTTGFMIRDSDPDRVEEGDGEEGHSSEDGKRIATYGQVVQVGDINYGDNDSLEDEDMEYDDKDDEDSEAARATMKGDRDYLRTQER